MRFFPGNFTDYERIFIFNSFGLLQKGIFCMKSARRFLYGILVLLFIVMNFPAFAEDAFYDTSVFAGKKIAVQTGSTSVDCVEDFIDNPDLRYYSATTDMITAVANGKVDACIADEPIALYLSAEIDGIRVEPLDSSADYIAFACGKSTEGEQLAAQLNEFIRGLEESGKLSELQNKWFNGSEKERTLEDYSGYPDINGTLKIATEASYAPFEYVKENRIIGFDIELVTSFCKEYGYRPVITNVDFSGIVAGVSVGKYDIGASGLTITEERKNSITFTDPVYVSRYAIVFRDEDAAEANSSIGESFRKTFLTESRWKIFAEGALVTIEITVISILAGTVLGFLWYLLCRKNIRAVNTVSVLFRKLVHGMPTVVLLMILYYIIFGPTDVSETLTAVIGFSIIFACFMISALETGVRAVDPGQLLAARALGYTDTRAFFKIILPQAAGFIWPSYIEEISSHIKATSIVGYIAVVDITKAGDIIRGRTYDAFFPLISVAIIYFIMAAVLKILLGLVRTSTDPYLRSQAHILRGVTEK